MLKTMRNPEWREAQRKEFLASSARVAIEEQRKAVGACPMCGAYNERRGEDARSGYYGLNGIVCGSCVQKHNDWKRQGVSLDEIQRRLRK